MKLTQGTVSWLFGYHSLIHTWYVIKAWKIIYRRWPVLWQIVCIFFHDIGYIGKQIYSQKNNKHHEILGARICFWLFGKKGYKLVYGHRASNKRHISALEAPDDFSQCLKPLWVFKVEYKIEGYGINPVEWKIYCCERWIKRFRGEQGASSLFKDKYLKEIYNVV